MKVSMSNLLELKNQTESIKHAINHLFYESAEISQNENKK